MTYDAFETSVEGARPVEVYEFTAGTSSYFFTTAEDTVSIGAQPYTPAEGMSRNKFVEGPERRNHDFQITLPATNVIARLFHGKTPGFRVRVQVRRFHRDDLPTPEVREVFDGRVHSASLKKLTKEVILTCRTDMSSEGRVVPRRTFQSLCGHVLYHPTTCTADDTDPAYRASALSVASVSGNTLTVSSGISGVYADDWMRGGYVEVVGDADYRLITAQTGNVITLFSPFADTPSTVNVFAGCGHTIEICDSKFGLVREFGGFHWVPTKNPYQSGL